MYEIIGAPESEIALLERLLNQTAGRGLHVFQQMFLLYAPSSSASETKGWQSDDPLSSLMGISQANLSTETHPKNFIASDRFLSDEKLQSILMS